MGLGAGFGAWCWVWGLVLGLGLGAGFGAGARFFPALLRERPVSFGIPPLRRLSPQAFCPQCCAPPFLSTLSLPRSPSGAPRFLRERVLRERPVSFGSAPIFFGSAPVFIGSAFFGSAPSVEPPALMSPVLPPPLFSTLPPRSFVPPFFVPSVTNLMFTYLLSAQIGSEQRFKDNPERQTRKTQDEPQWIVAQRRLSARTIPGFS